MRIPDRPVLNGILGVACALVVLALLSWPGIVGPSRAPSILQQQNTSSAGRPVGSVSSSSSSVTVVLANSPTTSAILSSTTLQTSSQPVFTTANGSISTSASGSSNLPFPAVNSSGNYSSSSVAALSNVKSNSTITVAQTATTATQDGVTTVLPVVTTVSSVLSSASVPQSTYGSSPSQFSTAASPVVDLKSFQTLGLLSVSSVIIAVGCTLFVFKRMEREESD